MVTNALRDKALPIYGDGKQQRDWLHVEDNCRGILLVLEKGELGEIYNIGGSGTHENLAICRWLLELTGKPETLLSYVLDRPGHDRRYALNCKKIETKLGWKPRIPLKDGLCETIDWYTKNRQWVDDIYAGDYLSYYDKYYNHREASLETVARSGVGSCA